MQNKIEELAKRSVILLIDIGNSNIVLGIYRDRELISQRRIRTDTGKTSNEYQVDLKAFFGSIDINLSSISGTALASVVTPLISVFQQTVVDLTDKPCLVVDRKTIPSMPIRVDDPDEVGIDRLINAFAAYEYYNSAVIIVDLGTATTFDVVSNEGEFLGGVISPGLKLSLNALVSKTSKLPTIELGQPKTVIGKNTVHCMQSGIVYGYAGMVDAMVSRIVDELGYKARVIATGGLAKIVFPISSQIEEVVDNLTLEGMLTIFQNTVD